MQNNLKTAVLLAGMAGLLIAIGSIFGRTGILLGFVFALVMVGSSYWFSDKMAIKAAGARPLEDGELPWLREMVADLAQRSGIPMPRLYIAPSPQPNAFATGRNPQHAAVAVTAGILQVLEKDELRGVLAHELGHVRNRDILLTSVAAMIGSTVTMVANFLPWGMFGGSNDREQPNIVFVLLTSILAPLFAGIMQMALSRSREFQADATGAALIEDGEPLARALQKIEAYAHQVPMNIDPAQASAYIINPLAGVNIQKLFSTHPPTAERVARLRAQSQSRFDPSN